MASGRRLDRRRDGQGRRHARAGAGHDAVRASPPTPSPTPRRSTGRCARRTALTFDRLDSDGCMSTNDTVLLLASGASGVAPTDAELAAACHRRCAPTWRRQLHRRRRGREQGDRDRGRAARPSEDDAVEVARAVARSNLLKCALYGEDPNWGRVLVGVGTTQADLRPDATRRRRSTACGSAAPARRARTVAKVDLTGREVSSPSTSTPATPRRRSGPTTSRRPTSTRTRRTRHDPSAISRPGQRRPRSSRRCRGSSGSTAGRRGEVRRQRDDRRRAAGGVRRRTWSSCATPGSGSVVVHGGGPQINAHLDRLGIEQRVSPAVCG